MKKLLLASALILGMSAIARASDEGLTSSAEGLIPAEQLSQQLAGDYNAEDMSYRRHFVCYARNGRGDRFRGEGNSPEQARNRARLACRVDISVICSDEGCRGY